MSSSLTPHHQVADNDAYALRQTNVSSPSVVHTRPSLNSFTASEDYYSLSDSSNSSIHSANVLGGGHSQQTITRYQTPPSRYRTPQQSTTALAQPQQQYAREDQDRKTPMRGHGKRRMSVDDAPGVAGPSNSTAPRAQGHLREGGIRRKPVPSTVMETSDSPNRISPTAAQSSVARDLGREQDAPTPGVDDTPYIHFALDQLTRDEEVRGSRRYPGIAPGIDGTYPYDPSRNAHWEATPQAQPQHRYEEVPQEEKPKEIELAVPPQRDVKVQHPHRLDEQPLPLPGGPNPFMPVAEADSRQPPLRFIPGILRPLRLAMFILAVLIFLILLLIAAIWSRLHMGLWDYGQFGDHRYFVFQYLPPLLGMLLLIWLIQIEIAVYRIAPFIAMGSASTPPSRIAGAQLPLQPKGFVLPYFGHFSARLPRIGTFLLVAWLQIWTIPLLSSAFNVYQDRNLRWRWIATQGAIWTVIVLYILLLAALGVLLAYFLRPSTGLKWDPRSLADLIVLLERSNALDGGGETAPQIGYWRTAHRPNEVFHAYGIADRSARTYGVEHGRITEKRYSDPDADLEANQPVRHSKEAMLPRNADGHAARPSSALPWYLKPSTALLWPIIAIVLLLAFLVVSYLPSTTVANGFSPLVPAAVDKLGFSGTNFLYSILPGVLAMLIFLLFLNIDYAHRRLAPFENLTGIDHPMGESWARDFTGDIAERTLLSSYASDLPVLVSLSAAVNKHWRVAFLSFVSLLNTAIPILAGGVFWAQFNIARQRVHITADMPAYYALTAFLIVHALAYLAILPSSSLRQTHSLPRNLDTFAGVRDCVTQSRILDDFAFRNPVSKTDLVTRLLSASGSGSASEKHGGLYPPPSAARNDAAASKVSLADSIRGFGRARVAAAQQPVPAVADAPVGGGPARYAFSRGVGRDGKESFGLDRVRAG